ncbi:PRA1 family protein G2 [Ricinus communis]|uniref:PRA1 family protein n=1 Tax=Ricinus communis TaxID=3988 RepID=B9T0I5_RICCO|nr:PRA1 family protein G2 [Ricinus communis]EEF30610.1 conserved hypothetical protein [Ricinus communis]|eukprot:XP_002531754.1 PRA1 family protein G2 [Ricinus communis]
MTQSTAATATATSTSTTTTTYTSIPISSTDVLSRSLHNLTTAISTHRPWPELIASGLFTRPDSLSSALTRLHIHFRYFRINYAIIVSLCGAVSLIGSPVALILFAFIFALWLLIYFFREDPLVLFGYQVSDRMVLIGLVVVSVLGIFSSGAFWSLVLGIVIGVLACGFHAILRNTDGLFLGDQEEASGSLIGSGSGPLRYGAVSAI